MHQQPAPSTFPAMPAPNMLGSRYAMMMMPGRIPDHVFGGTVFLASPTGPLPHTEQRFSLQRGEARPSRFFLKGRCSWLPNEEGEKNFYLEELKTISLSKALCGSGWGHYKCPLPGPPHPVSAPTECAPAKAVL